jgi:hypothetical protein
VKKNWAPLAVLAGALLTAGGVVATIEGKGGAASGSAKWGELKLGGRGQVHNTSCVGKHVVVDGTYTTVNLQGKCGRVLVSGDHNTVNIQDAGAVVLTGRANVINLQSKVGVSGRGLRNQINRP